jgi:hypothetical protein
MAATRDMLLLSVIATLLASCTTTSSSVRVAGIPVSGRIQDVTVADIEAALAAYEGPHPGPYDRPGEIEIVSHDQIRFYVARPPATHMSMIRVKGKWKPGGELVFVHPAY